MKVPLFHSFTGTDIAWATTRLDAVTRELSARLPGRDVHDMAVNVVSHWALETQWGASEYNYNLGGIHAYPSVDYFASTDAGIPTNFAAWHSLTEGVRAYLDLIQHHYAECWGELTADPPGPDNAWYNCLGAHHYYGVRGAYEDAHQRLLLLIGGTS